jgi:hypothetical protein
MSAARELDERGWYKAGWYNHSKAEDSPRHGAPWSHREDQALRNHFRGLLRQYFIDHFFESRLDIPADVIHKLATAHERTFNSIKQRLASPGICPEHTDALSRTNPLPNKRSTRMQSKILDAFRAGVPIYTTSGRRVLDLDTNPGSSYCLKGRVETEPGSGKPCPELDTWTADGYYWSNKYGNPFNLSICENTMTDCCKPKPISRIFDAYKAGRTIKTGDHRKVLELHLLQTLASFPNNDHALVGVLETYTGSGLPHPCALCWCIDGRFYTTNCSDTNDLRVEPIEVTKWVPMLDGTFLNFSSADGSYPMYDTEEECRRQHPSLVASKLTTRVE